eukprot:02538_5
MSPFRTLLALLEHFATAHFMYTVYSTTPAARLSPHSSSLSTFSSFVVFSTNSAAHSTRDSGINISFYSFSSFITLLVSHSALYVYCIQLKTDACSTSPSLYVLVVLLCLLYPDNLV